MANLPDDLLGCIERLNRANVHLKTLNDAVRRFIDSGAYGIRSAPAPGFMDTNSDEFAQVIIYGTISADPPVAELGTLIGDVVHNLRSMLDHLVWALSCRHSGPAPAEIIPKGPWRNIHFPVVLNVADWKWHEENMLWAIRPGLAADFERLQPYKTGQVNPEHEPIAVLDRLWRVDKHRHAHVTNFFLGLDDVRGRWPFPGDPPKAFLSQYAYNVMSKRDVGPFEDGAELGRVVEGGTMVTSMPEVHVEARLAFDIAFEQGAPAYGARVGETLKTIFETVAAILVQFEPEFT